MKGTNRPFHQILGELLAEREWSQRELARRCDAEAAWGSAVTISNLAQGHLPPTIRAMEVICGVLRESPKRYAEYRMAVLREQLNPGHVGYERALATLLRLER